MLRVNIYDVNGNEVCNLVNEYQESGQHDLTWDGLNSYGEKIASGVYYYKIKTSNHCEVRRMTLLK